MRRQRGFVVASWAALTAAVCAALLAILVAVTGAIGLLGLGDYRTDVELPLPGRSLDLGFQPSWGVSQVGDVCSQVDVRNPDDDCYNVMLHRGQREMDGTVWVPDDVRATEAQLSGRLYMKAEPGWNSLMASLYGMRVLSLLVLGILLVQLWLMLRDAARGRGFSSRVVRRLRALGWTLIAWELIEPLLWLFLSPKANEYVLAAIGPWPLLSLSSMEPGGPSWTIIGFGLLLLLLAELFQYGSELSEEQSLTV